ncbi:hypothetical protein DH2020_046170 [Rehmannia glutinosa]|uniref:Uncharacterized protein n=1 Tax=Rehmannia glutinosa TaxID=99300 RepID=A0ABR0UCY5_REHGL
MKNFDPTKEFENDETAYDIHVYQNDVFSNSPKKTIEELKYPYVISSYLKYCPVEESLQNLSPGHVAQSYLLKDLPPLFGKKTREYFEAILTETGSVEIAHMNRGIRSRSLKPAYETMRNMNHQVPTQSALLKELLQHMDKDSVAKLFKEVFEPVTTGTDKPSTSASSKDKNIQDTEMNDAQNPYEDEDLILEMMNREYEG